MALGKISKGRAAFQSVKCFFFLKMNKYWLASDKVLASSEKNAFCECNLTLLCLLEGKYETLEF